MAASMSFHQVIVAGDINDSCWRSVCLNRTCVTCQCSQAESSLVQGLEADAGGSCLDGSPDVRLLPTIYNEISGLRDLVHEAPYGWPMDERGCGLSR